MMIETVLTPAELPILVRRDLSGTACVVFDILRATSTFVTALQNGASEVVPVSEITDALRWRANDPAVLLAGERDGVRIRASQSGGTDFDFGNSPREFRPEKVRGRIIVSTTTNGTRALRACAAAQNVLAGSFLNLAATARFINQLSLRNLVLVCAGTGEAAALEDILAAGALAGLLEGHYSDSTETANRVYLSAKTDLPAVIATSENARRLLGLPGLRADVAYCSQRDIFKTVAAMTPSGSLRLK